VLAISELLFPILNSLLLFLLIFFVFKLRLHSLSIAFSVVIFGVLPVHLSIVTVFQLLLFLIISSNPLLSV